uniref:SecA family profile domain-containing protein n=1 Tax=Lactuca sativa TaxID=4236 RepID=A0A9R1XA01_LACSA|nr:hypothetical protein LSAT_V11C500282740 [Lactuca sativa]
MKCSRYSTLLLHHICLQVWLAVSLITDALAASGQALIASSVSKGNYRSVKDITYFVLTIGFVMGVTLAAILGVSFGSIVTLFTKDIGVLAIARTGVLFVSASQPLNAFAFIVDGLHYGVSDFPYAAYSMMLVGILSSVIATCYEMPKPLHFAIVDELDYVLIDEGRNPLLIRGEASKDAARNTVAAKVAELLMRGLALNANLI